MEQQNNTTSQQSHTGTLSKRMSQGACIGLVLIALFLAGAGKPNPEWGKLWMIKPLLMLPFAGAMGGLFFFLMDRFRSQGGWIKIVANIASLVVFLVGLWMGFVLGLNGTMWN